MVKHLLDTRQFKDREFLDGIYIRTREMAVGAKDGKVTRRHSGKIMASFFYQPSTRTKITFDAAAKRLGMEVVGTENASEFSSAYKGETLEHSMRAIEECFDVVVLRHPKSGAAKRAASVIQRPVINAGDGPNQHPTQSITDIYTIAQCLGQIDDLRFAFVGDVARGRTVRSLAYLLAHLRDNCLNFVAPEGLGLSDDVRSYLKEKNVRFTETDDLDAILPRVDVLYDTRLQWEYIKNPYTRWRLMRSSRRYQITPERADRMMSRSIIMHPLPINTEKSGGHPEIAPEVDDHPKARYFRQSNNGQYVRMALLDVLMSGPTDPIYKMILDAP